MQVTDKQIKRLTARARRDFDPDTADDLVARTIAQVYEHSLTHRIDHPDAYLDDSLLNTIRMHLRHKKTKKYTDRLKDVEISALGAGTANNKSKLRDLEPSIQPADPGDLDSIAVKLPAEFREEFKDTLNLGAPTSPALQSAIDKYLHFDDIRRTLYDN